jgi:hypothetical protein
MVPPTKPVATTPAPLPTEPFALSAPWSPAAPVPLVPLVLSEVKVSSVRDWKTTDLGAAGVALAGLPLHGTLQTQPTSDVPATIRGVLTATIPEKADPTPYSFTGPPGQLGPVWFSQSYGFPGWVRFVSDGRGDSVARLARKTLDGRTIRIDSAHFRPGPANPWKLTRAVHLVEVEINGGKGDATKDPSFVITNVRVLDRSLLLPLDLDAAVKALSARAVLRLKELETEGDAMRKAAEATIDRAARRVEAKESDGWGRELAPQPWVSWDDAKHELSIVHLQRREARYEAPPRPLPVQCLPGQPCAQMSEIPRFQIDVLQAVRQTVSDAGVLLEEVTYTPQVRVQRLP